MLHANKNAKEWWHKSDICSLCQNGKGDINHIFEECNTVKILKKKILETIDIKNLIIDGKNIKKKGLFITTYP